VLYGQDAVTQSGFTTIRTRSSITSIPTPAQLNRGGQGKGQGRGQGAQGAREARMHKEVKEEAMEGVSVLELESQKLFSF